MEKSAAQDDIDSLINLSALLELGSKGGPSQDLKRSGELLTRAAELGDIVALRRLGDKFLLKQDFKRAKENYLKAAEKGDAHSQCNLGELYFSGDGLGPGESKNDCIKWFSAGAKDPKYAPNCNFGLGRYFARQNDWQKAREYFLLVANKGNLDGICALGDVYHKEGNLSEAEKWLSLAVSKGHPLASALLKELNGEIKLKKSGIPMPVQKLTAPPPPEKKSLNQDPFILKTNTLIEQGKPQVAFSLFEEKLKTTKNRETVLYSFAQALLKVANEKDVTLIKQAQVHLREAHALKPKLQIVVKAIANTEALLAKIQKQTHPKEINSPTPAQLAGKLGFHSHQPSTSTADLAIETTEVKLRQ